MLVSWYCATYGRPDDLQNLVRMFLKQDYKNRELVILNDDPDVKYSTLIKNIKVINWERRFDNVRHKFNVCASYCNGDVLYHVADDDIYEPHATSMIVDSIGKDQFIAFSGFWKLKGREQKWRTGSVAALYACTKKFFNWMGGHKCWDWHKVGKQYEWKIHKEDFKARVMDMPFYKSKRLWPKNAFFTWNRNSDRSIWDSGDLLKYRIKKRNIKPENKIRLIK